MFLKLFSIFQEGTKVTGVENVWAKPDELVYVGAVALELEEFADDAVYRSLCKTYGMYNIPVKVGKEWPIYGKAYVYDVKGTQHVTQQSPDAFTKQFKDFYAPRVDVHTSE